MLDYIISAILIVFIISVLVFLKRRERGQEPRAWRGRG
jgi:hypothetical protein